MLSRQVSLKRQWLRLRHKCMCLRNFSQAESESKIEPVEFDTRLSVRLDTYPQREPFAKNLFLGKFDTAFLTYPQFISDDRLKEFEQWIKPLEDFMKCTVDGNEIDKNAPFPKELFHRLKQLDVFRMPIDEKYRGLALNNSEHTKAIEILSSVPALGVYFTQRLIPIHIISKYGSPEQKREYLPKLASGEITAAVCLTEKESGSNAMCVKSLATLSECENYWTLNGEKIFVPNAADADIFIVFSLCLQSGEIFNPVHLLSPLIVERERNGISTAAATETLSEHGLELCSVSFKDTIIPKENIIGQIGSANTILLDLFSTGKHNAGAQAIAILRNFINLLIEHVINEKHFDKPLYELPLVQEAIGNLSASLYMMESVTYLTTGIMDQYEDQDSVIESAIVKAYCTKECITSIHKGLDVLGLFGYVKGPYEQILKDALALMLYDGSNYDTQIHIALLGLQHAGKVINDEVEKSRNLYNYPKYALKQLFKSERKKKLKLRLIDYLHPTLLYPAQTLEDGLLDLKIATETLLKRHGYEVSEYHMELYRLSEMAIQLFVLVAVLGRASRSYCIGHRNADGEIKTAISASYIASVKVKQLLESLEHGEYSTSDHLNKEISLDHLRSRKYSFEHPLKRNF